MKVETKYSLDDKVWYILSNKVESSFIKRIRYSVDGKGYSPRVSYEIDGRDDEFDDKKLFSSKEELLKSL